MIKPITALASFVLMMLADAGAKEKVPADTAKRGAMPVAAAEEIKVKENGIATPITLAELTKSPSAFAGKEVVVTGIFSGICCATDFYLKDGLETIEVSAGTRQCPMPSKSKIRSKLRVRGVVKIHGDAVMIEGREIKYL